MAMDRRKEARHCVRVEVVVDDYRRFRCGATIDFSKGGVLVESEQPAEVGAHVTLIPLVKTSALAFEIPALVVRVVRLAQTGTYQMAMALEVKGEGSRAVEEICAAA